MAFESVVFAGSMGLLLPLLIGYPLAVGLGLGRQLRAIGFAAALGLAVLLIACRAAQVYWPIGVASPWILSGVMAFILLSWAARSVRANAWYLLVAHGKMLCALAVAVIVADVCLIAPILFGDALQFEGTRNADSFTFTSSARYMLEHAFHGAADVSPEHPVYTISRGYFGTEAMQPRPAAEGLLAWFSALGRRDPLYFYNALQAAGVLLAGLSVLAFLPNGWRVRSLTTGLIVLVYALACPMLWHVAINSNYANGLHLAAATAYVALALVPRAIPSFLAGVLLLGSLLSGYPELLAVAGLARVLGVLGYGFAVRSLRVVMTEAGWLIGELITAGLMLPWAAQGAWMVYRTTWTLTQVDAELYGRMYAGMPLFGAALLVYLLRWRVMRQGDATGKVRSLLGGVLMAFIVAQVAMVACGFDYGGFKISEYFVTLLLGVLLLTLPVPGIRSPPESGERWIHWASALAIAFASIMVVASALMVRRAWRWSMVRRVTPDLVQLGKLLPALSDSKPVALGTTPQPFYYGMWVPYLTDVAVAHDFTRDPQAAGYLSPYLQSSGKSAAFYGEAELLLVIDAPDQPVAHPDAIAHFGSVYLLRKPPR
ncbi:hypothetical protein [Dyella koreensis]|uniref:Glycosyltransferase RgtA/B/C/D-like domain-containing protein n=1 Tax=Dyella koreensis TaxID=311235 RepID=A0ABW8KA37_9GAMM